MSQHAPDSDHVMDLSHLLPSPAKAYIDVLHQYVLRVTGGGTQQLTIDTLIGIYESVVYFLCQNKWDQVKLLNGP